MKLILASSGLSAPESVAKLIEFVGKPASEINFAVINEAMKVEHGDHRWFLDDMDTIRTNFGGNIELIDLQATDIEEVKNRIAASDVIFVAGGNTDYLATIYEKTGFTKILPELLETKVYVGSSAGSCVLGLRPSYKTFTDVYKEAQYTDKYPKIVDFAILPHLHSEFFDTKNDEWAIEDSKVSNYTSYAISDHAAVVVDGLDTYIIGHDYLKLHSGKVL